MSEPFDQNKAVFIGRRALHESARWESGALRMNKNAKLLRSAGFRCTPSTSTVRLWVRGDLQIAVGNSQKLSLRKLIGYIIEQAAYRTRRGASLSFAPFKTENTKI